MSDFEIMLERWIDRAVEHYGKSDAELKMHSVYASPIVGKYQNGGTAKIAERIKRDTSTVENYAHAHQLYVSLRRAQLRKRVRTLWRELPISHWYGAWSIDKAGYDAFHYLDNAELHGWSGRKMADEFKKDLEAGTAPLVFKRGIVALRGLVNEMLLRFNNKLTEGQRIALLSVADEFTESETK